MLLLGLAALWGWAFQIAWLKSLIPGLATLKANSALGFVLAGVALTNLGAPQSQAARGLVLACAITILAVSGLTLVEHVSGRDLGIDQLLFPDRDTPAALHPGRLATASTVGLLLAGLALLSLPFAARHPSLATLSKVCAYAVAAIGAIALIGYGINFNFLYTWYAFGSMGLNTALGLVLLGAGLGAAQRQAGAVGDDVKITRLATVLLACAAGFTGLAVAAIIEREVERALEKGLRIGLESQVAQVEAGIQRQVTPAAIVAARPDLRERLHTLLGAPDRPDRQAALQAALEDFMPYGFSAVAVELPDGRTVASLGDRLEQPALAMPGPAVGAMTTELLWQGGFYLRQRLALGEGPDTLGTLVTEEPLPNLTRIALGTEYLGSSTEFLLCRTDGPDRFRCFPSRLTPIHSPSKPRTMVPSRSCGRPSRTAPGSARPSIIAASGCWAPTGRCPTWAWRRCSRSTPKSCTVPSVPGSSWC